MFKFLKNLRYSGSVKCTQYFLFKYYPDCIPFIETISAWGNSLTDCSLILVGIPGLNQGKGLLQCRAFIANTINNLSLCLNV